MAANSLIGNLAVTLGLETAAFEAGAAKAEVRANTLRTRLAGIGDAMKGFAGGLIAGVGVAAITGLARNAFEMASALDESAQKMGVSVEALQELNLAAKQSGISEESLATSIQRMNKSVGALAQGSKPAVDAFAKLGLTFEDLKGKAPDQQLRIIADALNKLPDVQTRVAVGSQIMGRSFSELLPLINGGSDALNKYAETSRNNGQITTEEAKRLDELADSWDRVKITIGVFAAKMIAMFAEMADKGDAFLARWYAWRDGVIKAVTDMASGALSAMSSMVSGIKNAFTGGLGKWIDWAKDKIQGLGDKFKWLWDVTVGHSYIPDMVDGIADNMARLQQVMVDPTLSATQKTAAAFEDLSGIVSKIFGSGAGSIFSAVGKYIPMIASLFGGGKIPTIDLPAFGTPGNTPGFANGGAGTFGGFGGVDKNLISMNGSPLMRVSKGEHFSVSPNGPAANDVNINQTFQFQGVAVTKDEFVSGLMMTKSATLQAIHQQNRRR